MCDLVMNNEKEKENILLKLQSPKMLILIFAVCFLASGAKIFSFSGSGAGIVVCMETNIKD